MTFPFVRVAADPPFLCQLNRAVRQPVQDVTLITLLGKYVLDEYLGSINIAARTRTA
jgi:hypothetical protein